VLAVAARSHVHPVRRTSTSARAKRSGGPNCDASLNRPGGNLTGVASLVDEIGPKRLELVHELLPTTRVCHSCQSNKSCRRDCIEGRAVSGARAWPNSSYLER
jgi:hypothetical protein